MVKSPSEVGILRYLVESRKLMIQSDKEGVMWTGKPEDYDVVWGASVPDSEDGVVLYDYYRPNYRGKAFQNLVRIRPDASVVWRAELPESDDKYVSANLNNKRLRADSWNGYLVEIDLQHGGILSREYHK
jgi:hypothetical protein